MKTRIDMDTLIKDSNELRKKKKVEFLKAALSNGIGVHQVFFQFRDYNVSARIGVTVSHPSGHFCRMVLEVDEREFEIDFVTFVFRLKKQVLEFCDQVLSKPKRLMFFERKGV